MTDLQRHISGCLAALERFGMVCEFDRMRALHSFPDLHGRTDAGAYREALDRITVRPCLPPAPGARHWKERRALARWLIAQGFSDGRVFRLP
jgi:hypothetical protein